jgi:hypothetical protein
MGMLRKKEVDGSPAVECPNHPYVWLALTQAQLIGAEGISHEALDCGRKFVLEIYGSTSEKVGWRWLEWRG